MVLLMEDFENLLEGMNIMDLGRCKKPEKVR